MFPKKLSLFIIALTVLLAGCQQSAQPESVPDESTATQALTSEPNTSEPESVPDGGTATRALTSEPGTLDPHGFPSSGQNVLMPYLFDTLIFRDKEANVHPYLAERWDVSESGTEITFYLRQDVVFHDGTPLNADAVVFTFNRFRVNGVKSPFYGSLSKISAVEAVDDFTVRMTLDQPSSTIYSVLASPYFGIISPKAAEEMGDDFGLHPVGSGPFKFEQWEPGVSLTLVRNTDYRWGPPILKNQGAPFLSSLEFTVIPDSATQLSALGTGEVDMLFVNDPATIGSLEDDPQVSVLDVPLNGLVYVGFNFQKTPHNEKGFRQAIAHAINKDEILQTALSGVGELAFSPLSPTLPGFSADLKEFELGFDLERANALLAEIGFSKNGEGLWQRGQPGDSDYSLLDNLVLLTSTRAPNEEIALVIQSNLKALGIPIEIQMLDSRAASSLAAEGGYDLMLWRYDWSDSDILYTYLSSARIGGTNRNFYSNPDLDLLLESALAEMDDVSRNQLYFDAQKMLMDDLPWIPLYVPRDVIAIRSAVQDVVVGQMGRILLNDAKVVEE